MFDEFISALEKVASLGEEVVRQEAGVLEQETQALEKIVAMVKPVMRFIDYPIEDGRHHSGHQFHSWKVYHYKERGIVLVDRFSREFTDKDYRGIYTGSQLVLTRSGALVVLSRQGDWSNWQGEPCSWDAKATEITPEEAVKRYGLAEIIKGMLEAFREAIKKAETKRQVLGKRLETLEQVKSILGS
ncbi:MAG: hypothetical protein AB1330_10795 [Bacillota bacterium]